MLGLSIGKILVVVAVVLLVWRGMRMLGLVAPPPPRRPVRGGPRVSRAEAPSPPVPVTDLQPCPRCGTFVPAGTFCPSGEACRLPPRA